MCKQVIHRTTVATSSTHLSSNDACHCKALWFSVGNELIIHYTSTITCTRQQQQHTKDAKYTCTLPSTKRHCMLSWKEKMPFEKQIHKLLYIISQRQTKIKHIKKGKTQEKPMSSRSSLWKISNLIRSQSNLNLTGLSFFESPAVFLSDFLCAS